MRRARVVALFALVSGLFTVLLAVAVNVATGGRLPAWLDGVAWLAWPAVGLLAALGVVLGVWQQRLAELRPVPVDVGRVAGKPAELPAGPAVFAGRMHDLAVIDSLIAGGCQVLVVVGPPGIGKSSLALHAAHARVGQYPDGQLFASLGGADAGPVAPETVLTRFLGSLGVPDDERRGSVDELAAQYRSALAGRSLLIVLDDAADTEQVRPLLPGRAGCLVLVTSRRPLLELPHAVPHVLGGLDEEDALALLVGTVGHERVAADREGAERTVQLCGGLPLAVRIAGGRLRVRPGWTPSDLAAGLADEHRRLDELRLGDLAVRSSFETSYLELPPVDRLVFRRSGSHPGRIFGVGAAAALAGLDETTTATVLERLVDAQVVESPASGRYRLHDLLRLFAGERLATEELPGDREACLKRLLGWLTTCAGAGDLLPDERDNVVAAMHQAVTAGAHEQAWVLACAVHPLLHGAGSDGRELLAGANPDRLAVWRDAAVAAEALGNQRNRARALRWVSYCYRAAGEVTRGLEPATEAAAIAQRLGDPQTLVENLFAYGEALRDLNRLAEARAVLERALELVTELSDDHEEIQVRTSLGSLHNQALQPELAVAVLEPAVNLLPAGDDDVHAAWTLNELGAAYRCVGRYDEAVALNHRALRLCRQAGYDYARGYVLQEHGWLALDAGRLHDAGRHMYDMLAVFEQIRYGTGIGLAHEAIGEVADAGCDLDGALEAYSAASAQYERLRDRARAARSRMRLAGSLAVAGSADEARKQAATADALMGDSAPPDVSWLLHRLRTRLGEPAGEAGEGVRAAPAPRIL